jgi:hypothetical protein
MHKWLPPEAAFGRLPPRPRSSPFGTLGATPADRQSRIRGVRLPETCCDG